MSDILLGPIGLNIDRDFTLEASVTLTGVEGQGQTAVLVAEGEETFKLGVLGFNLVSQGFPIAQAQDGQVTLTGVQALGRVANMRGWTVSVTVDTATGTGRATGVRAQTDADVVRSRIFASVRLSRRSVTLI